MQTCRTFARTFFERFLLLLILAVAVPKAGGQTSSNGVLREVYLNIGGNSIAELTAHPNFPNNPSLESIQPIFEAPSEFAENYGQRLRALLIPPLTGNYVFWIASDDGGALFLSTTNSPAQKVQIATVNSWTSSREWTKEPNQQSAPIPLTAGQLYYIEALQKEGGGGDNLAVRWQLPNGVIEAPIPQNRLLVFGLGPPVISRNPTNVTVIEGGAATFTVQLERMIGATFQWQRDGLDIPGATASSYSIGPLTLADSTRRFRCFIRNPYGTTNSAEAVLTVVPDSTRPTVNTVGNLGENDVLFVAFSEAVEPATATNTSHYGINGGQVTVLRASFGGDQRTVILTTTPMPVAVTNTISISNVRDLASTPNTMLPVQRTFIIESKPIDISHLSLPREALGPSSRRHGVVISEVMYHPTNRTDGRNLEFVEIHNSQPWFEELGGWRLSGAIDYVFPAGTVVPARGFLVVAGNPDDFRAIHTTLPNVLGPFLGSNALQNSSGTLRLRNASDAVVFEMNYSGDLPFPPEADGAGPSLILARPSYGEGDPRAWAASTASGGTPGTADPQSAGTYRNLVINEFLANSFPAGQDFIELHNYGNTALNISGLLLTDDADTNKFAIPPNTIIPARGLIVFTEEQLGFGLSSGGETIYLRHSSGRAVIDAVRFGDQENGIPTGRYPDGASTFTRLATPTPGSLNAPSLEPEVVIHEILFDPISNNSDDEFIELHNRSTQPVNVGGWRLRDGVSFNIPENSVIPAGGFLVIGRNAARLRTTYAQLNTVNCLGNYSGTLANGGERIELRKPADAVSTNTLGQLRTNVIYVAVDEVRYAAGGRWGRWSNGGGSSLELRDARADNRLAPNWADSDETDKSAWVTVEATGVMDHGWADAYQLHVTLLGAGEALIDNVEVIPAGSTNLIGNGTFEGGVSGWTFQGNHAATSWEPGEGFNSSASLHLRTTGRGDSGANRIRTQLPFTLSPGTTVTLRARVRWLKGNPNVLLRLRGNWMEAPGYVLTAANPGTPGQPNSQSVANAGPAITDVRHSPVLPAASQPVLVTARVHDPDRLAYLVVNYRIDPDTNFTSVAMTNNGAGLYSTVLPGRAAGVTAAFHIRALDSHPSVADSTFPNDAPARECVIRWGDTTIPGTLGTYRFWITQTNINRWSNEERMSNLPKDVTFLYGTNRVIYNAGAWFHGSPYHSPAYNSPVGNSCDYDMAFPRDERLLGETDINLFRPGNGGGDGTAQAEIHGYWFGHQFGIPFLYHRPVFVFVNGARRDTLYHDAQQPNGDFVEQWYPSDPDGDLHKIQLGFEFGDQATGANEAGYAAVGANLGRYTTTGGVMKQARYRQTWPRRAAPVQELNDYTNIYNLVNLVLTNAPIGSEAYTTALTRAIDVEEWYKVHVTQHLYNNGDSFSYGGGQNAFAYKPERDTWKLFLWDIDFAFGGSPTDANLTGIGGADHGPRNDHPPFARIYWQTLIEAANGLLTAARSNPILDARYNGMTSSGAAVGSPQGIKDFIAARRNFILTQIAARQSPFRITSNSGADFTTNRNLVTLSGTAPLDVRTILVNGVPYAATWTSLSNWVIRIPLSSGTNTLQFAGLDSKGVPVAAVSAVIRINYTGANELPEDRIVLNEIMYHPAKPDAGYIELFNSSAANAFDLSGWQLNGANFTFPAGTVIEPGAHLLIVENITAFTEAYGPSATIAGTLNGQLDHGGETLTLIAPGVPSQGDAVIDQVTFDDDLPWPAAADGFGPSLQLIDAGQDNNRVANWAVAASSLTNPPQAILPITATWRYSTNDAFNDAAWTQPAYPDGAWLSGPALLYYEDAALSAPKSTQIARGRTTYYFRTRFQFNGSLAGAALRFSPLIDDGAVFYLNGQEFYRLRMPVGSVNYAMFSSGGVGDATYEGPFIVPASALVQGENVLAVEVHQQNSTSSDIVFGMTLDVVYSTVAAYTPGTANSVRNAITPFPPLWLNEVLPNNILLGTNTLTDSAGDRDPWVELYNGGTTTLNLDGWRLGNSYTNLAAWTFPANTLIGPKQFLLVWLDGEPGESTAAEPHASFRCAPETGSVYLSRGTNAESIVDYLHYNLPVAGRSYGSFPDGAVSGRRVFSRTTPRGTNDAVLLPLDIRINEWMADNAATLADPADDDYEDWIELFNPGTNAVDLSGCFLGDSLTNAIANPWRIPDGTVIEGRSHLLIWADGETGQNSNNRIDLHAGFSLAKAGEEIALFAPDGTIIDAITFGPQATDVSEGRYPDGSAEIRPFSIPTPRAANAVATPNTAPSIEIIPSKLVNEGTLLAFDVIAFDTNFPPQTLAYTLDPGAPAGATIHPTTGRFGWVPDESQGPGNYLVNIRVTDNGVPSLSETQQVSIEVLEVNNPPQLAPVNSLTLPELSVLTITNSASDPDPVPQVLTFSLSPGSPDGMAIHPQTGLLTWTPGEAQGPGVYTVQVEVTDNGIPPLTTTMPVTLTITEVNTPPEFTPVPLQTLPAGRVAEFVVSATDADLPLQSLTFTLEAGGPATATLDPTSGQFQWLTTAADVGTNRMQIRVRDGGSPSLFAIQDVVIVVTESIIASIALEGQSVSITFEAVPGKQYQLEAKSSLEDTEWIPVGNVETAQTNTLTLTAPASGDRAFYRVARTD